jgi:proteic killer suppression protein
VNIHIFVYSTMEIIFKKDYLAHLYEGNTKPYKEYKSNQQLVTQYVKTINKLKSITKIEQLYQIKSLNYEKKVGNLEGISAVWINKQYRVLFVEVASKPGNVTIDLLEIEELSKHYQ